MNTTKKVQTGTTVKSSHVNPDDNDVQILILLFQGLHLSQIPVLRLFWRCILYIIKKNIRIYFIYFCTFAKTIILLPSLMQSFNLTRFADPACCTVPKCWTPPTLPFHPPKTPRCINPLVEAKWAPAIVGSDQWNQQWRQDHG